MFLTWLTKKNTKKKSTSIIFRIRILKILNNNMDIYHDQNNCYTFVN